MNGDEVAIIMNPEDEVAIIVNQEDDVAIIVNHEEADDRWEDRALGPLDNSKIDQAFSAVRGRRAVKKHKLKWMARPIAIPQVILELQEVNYREAALRALSFFLLEKREDDPDNYNRAGYLLFHSCATVTLLLQEVLSFYPKMTDGNLNVRSSKRLANVLTLFQTIAANTETRQKFVDAFIPNFLVPLINYKTEDEVFKNVQAVSLSVIGILCQAREPRIVKWATENDIVEACFSIIESGNELSKVVAMHTLEAILQDSVGSTYIFSRMSGPSVRSLVEKLHELIKQQDVSPRLIFHIIRFYLLLSAHPRGLRLVLEFFPCANANGPLKELTQEFPIIKKLHRQLLVNVGLKLEITPLARGNGRSQHHREETIILPSERHPIFNLTACRTTPMCPSDLYQTNQAFTYANECSNHADGRVNGYLLYAARMAQRQPPLWGL